MREIKFRAWDGESMYVIDSLYFFEEEGIHEIVNSKGKGAHCNYDIMQFTGLKDKNGKDIYEGDILSNGMVNPKIGVVNYRNCYFEIRAIKNFSCLWNNLSISNMSYKVIGSIYENPDILEQ